MAAPFPDWRVWLAIRRPPPAMQDAEPSVLPTNGALGDRTVVESSAFAARTFGALR
jgi:hypothetical protein